VKHVAILQNYFIRLDKKTAAFRPADFQKTAK
jgi:hypothetical protein